MTYLIGTQTQTSHAAAMRNNIEALVRPKALYTGRPVNEPTSSAA